MLISVIIRVRNAENDLLQCFHSLLNQRLPEGFSLEFVVVDNDSTDSSAAIAERYHAKVVKISRSEFSWGRALNRGIENSQGSLLLLISADVEPVGDEWLNNMLSVMASPQIAAVYARQIPRINAPIDEVARLAHRYPAAHPPGQAPWRTNLGFLRFLSNACALVRRETWELVRFDEHSNGGEEQPWMESLLGRGYSYAYASSATAYHSHRESAGKSAYRLWELHRENMSRQGRRPSVANVGFALISICKRRLLNIIQVQAPTRIRMEGLISLPLEIGCFLIVGFLEGLGVSPRTVRTMFWR